MVLSEQMQRTWRLLSIVCSVGVGIQAVLYTEYNLPTPNPNEKHVFTDLQRNYRIWLDRNIYGIEAPPKRELDQTSISGSANDDKKEKDMRR